MNRAKPLPSLSVFFPAYNDAGSIGGLVERANDVARALADDVEIIVVNDGSRDETAGVLQELQTRLPTLRVVTHASNRGYGGALRSGFAAARKDWVFYTDGDGQYDPAELSRLVTALRPGVDWVNGYKLVRRDPYIRILIGSAYNALVRALFRIAIRDVDCDFRLIRRSRLEPIQLESDSGAICVELACQLHARFTTFAEVGIPHYHRRYGGSQFFNVHRVFETGRQLIGLWRRLAARKHTAFAQHESG